MAAEFTTTRRVEFCETDLAGVMHFSNYFRVMEQVEHEFWRSLGLSVISDDETRVSWPRKSTSFEYHRPVRFEDEMQCRLIVTKLGDRSITYEVNFSCRGEPVAKGTTTMVCCRMKDGTFESVPIPAKTRARFERAIAS